MSLYRLLALKNAPLIGSIFILSSFSVRAQHSFSYIKYPEELKPCIETLLPYFPELDSTRIEIIFRNSKSPLVTKPVIGMGIFSKSKRRYRIVISNTEERKFKSLLFANLPEDAQTGVLAHELSHVFDFSQLSFLQLMKRGMQRLSKKGIDRMEYNTDKIVLEHGLGIYLLAWSVTVRERMHIDSWLGKRAFRKKILNSKRERYMNPQTIRNYLDSKRNENVLQ